MSRNDIHDYHDAALRMEEDVIDAVVDIRSRRRCHYERSGLDPITTAVHLWAETGEMPGWDAGLDDGGGWAA
ncbi:hypothetical protein [Nocardia mexicana]|uniref:Uncharacterized protein n=1 Tax=Nocardia mexicana TaxID=279262 RepID=A0A370GY09_9NOCA|nr:hypothetical protein [Nocardia mexicana]RDI48532.1 hypothetical protein DFR68_108365 [Nocardia mexicana]